MLVQRDGCEVVDVMHVTQHGAQGEGHQVCAVVGMGFDFFIGIAGLESWPGSRLNNDSEQGAHT